MNLNIQPLSTYDETLLWEMLYLALYVPEGDEPYPRDTVQLPEIARYVADWGREGDAGFKALDEHEHIGAAWMRLFPVDGPGYGFVNDATPELSIAVLPEHRGRGIGTQLLEAILADARKQYTAVSLSVDLVNPARRLYERFGFEAVENQGDSITMLKKLG